MEIVYRENCQKTKKITKKKSLKRLHIKKTSVIMRVRNKKQCFAYRNASRGGSKGFA